jgi:hypothetical protein
MVIHSLRSASVEASPLEPTPIFWKMLARWRFTVASER